MSYYFPSEIGIKSLKWVSQISQGHQKNPLAPGGRVFDWGGQVRKIQLVTTVLTAQEQAILTAFLLKVGVVTEFYYTDSWFQDFRGDTASAVVVTSQTSEGFFTSGWPSNADIGYKGDYVSVNGRIYALLANVTSGESGAAFLPVSPKALPHVAPGSLVKRGSAIEGKFRLVTKSLPELSAPFVSSGITLEMREVL